MCVWLGIARGTGEKVNGFVTSARRRRQALALVDAVRFKGEADMRRGNREDIHVPPIC